MSKTLRDMAVRMASIPAAPGSRRELREGRDPVRVIGKGNES